jgi:molecular chaperone IbpA
MTRTFAFPRNAFLGFDHLFDELERIHSHAKDTYPPHNVIKDGEFEYTIELAVAGFTQEDLSIELKDHVLTVTGERKQRREQDVYIHHGISTRKFVKSYRLSEYTEVTGADLKDGILSVNLAVRLPEEQKPKLIKIGS